MYCPSFLRGLFAFKLGEEAGEERGFGAILGLEVGVFEFVGDSCRYVKTEAAVDVVHDGEKVGAVAGIFTDGNVFALMKQEVYHFVDQGVAQEPFVPVVTRAEAEHGSVGASNGLRADTDIESPRAFYFIIEIQTVIFFELLLEEFLRKFEGLLIHKLVLV